LIEETKKLGIEFPTLIDNPSQVLGFEQPSVLPTTLIFNPKGELHQTLVGPQTQQSLEQVLLQ
ncbi:MAG: TlpA family protein disulfide reductase, partial [Spongiibacteraceae bacterium]|nr:TlpA family protein disulfide reductase [Spongiibacteraceae bacterium]